MLLPIKGKALIARTFENSLKFNLFTRLLVATDDERIETLIHSLGGETVMTSDCQSGSERLSEVLKKNPSLQKAKVIFNIQGDEPLLQRSTVLSILEAMEKNPEASIATAITPIQTEEEALSPHVVKCVTDNKGEALYFSRALIPSNKLGKYRKEDSYFRHIGLYAFKPDFLLALPSLSLTPLSKTEDLEQLKFLEHGYTIATALVQKASPGVDTLSDIKKIEALL